MQHAQDFFYGPSKRRKLRTQEKYHVPFEHVSAKNWQKKTMHKVAPREEKERGTHNESFLLSFEQLEIFDPGFHQQWHLLNHDQPGHDLNVTGVWRQGITGDGVLVAMLDDGLDYTSQDLKEKYIASSSFDFVHNKLLQPPSSGGEAHGTRCAGQVSAAKNAVCGVGVAYKSFVSGIRVLSDSITEDQESKAFKHSMTTVDIYSCSFGPSDDGMTLDGPPEAVRQSLELASQHGRGGRGSIFVFASGNGGRYDDDCNMDGYANSPYTITVGAIDRHDMRPFYVENCAAQLISTYSSGDDGLGLFTTDTGENRCTSLHGGTSAAAPLASGVLALVVNAAPHLTYRTIMHLVVESAVPLAPTDLNGRKVDDWQTLPTGRRFSHFVGFGKLDAYKIVEAAKIRKNVGPLVVWTTGWNTVKEMVPPDHLLPSSEAWIEKNFEVPNNTGIIALEHVILSIDVLNVTRGRIMIELTSPRGARSNLLRPRPRDRSDVGLSWNLSSVVHWGEPAEGKWNLRFGLTEDPGGLQRAYWDGFALEFRGEGVQFPLIPIADEEIILRKTVHVDSAIWTLRQVGLIISVAVLAAVAIKSIANWALQKNKRASKVAPVDEYDLSPKNSAKTYFAAIRGWFGHANDAATSFTVFNNDYNRASGVVVSSQPSRESRQTTSYLALYGDGITPRSTQNAPVAKETEVVEVDPDFNTFL